MWLFGGNNYNGDRLGDMFELRMSSLTWNQIQTAPLNPEARAKRTLTATADDKLVLHGGCTDQGMTSITLSDTWIMDLTSYSWRKFTSKKDHPWEFHTGSTGLNHSIIIFGGSIGDLDAHEVYNSIFNVMLGPDRLQQLAMQAILKYQNELPLDCLPRKLLSLLDISVNDQDVCWESEPLHFISQIM